MKIYDSVGCSIDGVSEKEFEKFKKVGWMTEEEYKKLHPEDFGYCERHQYDYKENGESECKYCKQERDEDNAYEVEVGK